jgi:penicillin amidase
VIEPGESLRVNGVIFPGLPGVILGHNDFGAWGATVSGFDVTDVYIETITTPPDYPASPRTVLFHGEQVPVIRLEETVRVRGAAPVTAIIEVVPHHGPMLPDPNRNDGVVGLAATGMTVRWTGHEITLDSRFLLDLNLARDVNEFRNALQNFATGGQNWIWADVSGDIAYFPYVLVPQRPAGSVPYLPMPGTGEAEWLTDDDGSATAGRQDLGGGHVPLPVRQPEQRGGALPAVPLRRGGEPAGARHRRYAGCARPAARVGRGQVRDRAGGGRL